MTNEDILIWAKSIHYAHIDKSPDFRLSYGKAAWEKGVPELSEEQRAMLVKQIEEWEAALGKRG